jgi:hypothetical protein
MVRARQEGARCLSKGVSKIPSKSDSRLRGNDELKSPKPKSQKTKKPISLFFPVWLIIQP